MEKLGMPFSEPNVKNALQSAPLLETDSSQMPAAHSSVLSGMLIAEIEVLANDYCRMSLGTFPEPSQPKGFCVTYNVHAPEDVTVSITTSTAKDGIEYCLEISNSTARPIVAEVRTL